VGKFSVTSGEIPVIGGTDGALIELEAFEGV